MKTTLTILGKVKVNNFTNNITVTTHGLERMEERNINVKKASGYITELGEAKLTELKNLRKETILVNQKEKVSVVIAFLETSIRIITVINKGKVFAKNGTEIINI